MRIYIWRTSAGSREGAKRELRVLRGRSFGKRPSTMLIYQKRSSHDSPITLRQAALLKSECSHRGPNEFS